MACHDDCVGWCMGDGIRGNAGVEGLGLRLKLQDVDIVGLIDLEVLVVGVDVNLDFGRGKLIIAGQG